MTRILGIDPGSRVTGFAVLDVNGAAYCYVVSGCIRTTEDFFPARLREIFSGIEKIVQQYLPQEMAIENVFVKRNVSSALKLGQARGAAICAVLGHPVGVFEYSPTSIKRAVVGKGNAAKEQVQHMVMAVLKLSAIPQADAADALAVALCHAQSRRLNQQISDTQAVGIRKSSG